MTHKPKKEAEFLAKQMKKGFISTLILLVLENEKSHGYKILKEIEKRTMNMWSPSTSTIYRLLDSLEERDLVNCIEEQESGRQKRIFEITENGKQTLKKLLQRYDKIHESMKSIISTTLNLTGESEMVEELGDLVCFGPRAFLSSNGYSDQEKLEKLAFHKRILKKRIKKLKRDLQKVDNELERIRKNE
jgi:PadR family transcriptional regulator, regulatory protein PadR